MSRDTMLSDLAASIDGDRPAPHDREFARRVKLWGTPEELESFGYLEATMAGVGYHTTLLFHDAYIGLPGHVRQTRNRVAYASREANRPLAAIA